MKPVLLLLLNFGICTAALPDLNFVRTRFFGGSGPDTIVATAVDAEGNLIVAGTTRSPDIPGKKVTILTSETNLLRSQDAGRSWSRTGSYGVAPFALASNPTRPSVVVGCDAKGFLRSADSGVNWDRVGMDLAPLCSGLASDPANPSVFYAGFYSGANGLIYKSVDAGVSWTLLSNTDFPPYLLTVDPFDSSILFAHGSGAIYLSADAGRTWRKRSPDGPASVVGFALDPRQAGHAYTGSWNSRDLFVTFDRGVTWKRQATPLGRLEFLLIDPDRPGTLWSASTGREIYRSDDAGLHWAQAGALPSSLQRWIALPGGVLVAVTFGGIYRSEDRGDTWTRQHTARPYHLHASGNSGEVLACLSPAGDVFVSKLGPGLQEVQVTTVFGGQGIDQADAMLLDSRGNIVVAAQSAVLPSDPSAAIGYEMVVSKLAANGERLLFEKRLGKTANSHPAALAIDAQDNIYVAGAAASRDWPTTAAAAMPTAPGAQDGFAAKLSPSGELLYSTYVGGSGADAVSAIAIGRDGSAWLTGSTDSTDFPVTADALQSAPLGIDAFVLKLNPAGSRIDYSTYQGGAGWDAGSAIAIDPGGDVFVAGTTFSRDFPTSSNAFATTLQAGSCTINFFGSSADGFVMKLNGANRTRAFSTLTGSLCLLRIMRMKLADGAILLSGEANPARMPDIYPFRMDPIGGTPVAFAGEMSLDGAAWKIAALMPGGAPSLASSGGSVFVSSIPPYARSWWEGNSKPFSSFIAAFERRSPAPRRLRLRSLTAALDTRAYSDVLPGDLAALEVEGLDDVAPANLFIHPGRPLPPELNGVRVRFDGLPAPVMSVEPGVIVCVVPSAIDASENPYRLVEVEYRGETSGARLSLLRPWPAPKLFKDAGAVVARHEDGSLNSDSNQAPLGSVVTLYATGLGRISPPLEDGGVAPASPLSVPLALFRVNLGGVTVEPDQVSTLPGFVSAVFQIKVRIPTQLPFFQPRLSVSIHPEGGSSSGPGDLSVRR